ncbi:MULTISPECIES: ABC transporter substrate-binding protein [unclassified Mesorhizobium]|uniref:ABC transporter substrate-binding protein n=1 Tax=unclassified Mesorhizobium TaxID=325217 RepID=UPI000966524A|nr:MULTISPECIES: ABC transporter substrate-binding protein [unclassified Mesorhizobium]MBN9253552.1 ABC transporter substrate-binding protein [Mesorhizobium sp.]OJX82026.1 MAG: sugar ABC transporter substrate-binding protein [Mesorhizobium sp. 65-26]
MSNISRRLAMLLVGAAGLAALAAPVLAQDAKFYNGAPRTYLYNPNTDVCFKDTTQYKKEGPYTIGFSNAGLGDSWRVVMLHSLEASAAKHKDQIKKLIITDAGHDDAKQVADIQDLISRGVDLLIVSANTQQALDPAVSQAMAAGIPVVMVDRRVASDNFVTFVTASDAMMGRLFAQWIVEKLHGKGNVVMLAGQAGSSPSENREKPAREVFAQYPGIKVLETVYSDWSPVKGKQVMQAMIAKYGKQIDAVWSAHGLQTPGSIEAFIEAGYKDGEIPPHTTSDVNGPLQMAIQHKVPMLEVGYPPAMGGVSVDVALQVLAGAPVPCIYTINSQIAVSEGDNTPSIETPLRLTDMVVPKGAPDMLITGGMGPDYDPKTFKVDFPQ